jgi:hypothetical protein
MNTHVALLLALRLLLLAHVDFVLVIHEVNDWCPRVTVVDVVAEPRCINNSKFNLERLFLQLGLDDLNLLVCLFQHSVTRRSQVHEPQ